MAIYKLKELINSEQEDLKNSDDQMFVNISTANMKSNFSGFEHSPVCAGKILVPPGRILLSGIRPNFKKCIINDFYAKTNNDILVLRPNNFVMLKYLFYLIVSNWDDFTRATKGTKMPRLDKNAFYNSQVEIPNLITQQAIIDIIEPIETFAELVKKIINKMDSLFRSYSKNGRRTNFNLNELVNFVKGKTVKSTDFKKNGTPFIDVRYLNSAKISKYVDKSPNITYDDILLSLDGSTGIVKTGYSGYNGYVYKVSSTKINNFEIYLNLINDFNQSIISANSVGTTIKHASTAKKIMEYFDYTKYSSSYLLVVKRYFEKLLNTIMQIINKCVTMLIK
jgi:restriction endonuclease S subunit